MEGTSIRVGPLVRLLGAWRGEAGVDAAYRLLARALRLSIVDGRLACGMRLPGERELARALGVSRTTSAAAYGQLRDEGYLVSRRGSGSVANLPLGRPTGADPIGGGDGGYVVDWTAAALPAPPGMWTAYEEALRRLPSHLSGIGYDSVGLQCLREAVARDYERRGCPTRAGQVMVTSGAQNGLSLVLRALAGPGDRIAIDHPTYHNALGAIVRHSCQPVPVSLPDAGWDVEALGAAFRQTSPRLAYLQPDFHNPTGRLMTAAERESLVAAAACSRTPLLIDETMVETGFGSDMPPPVAAFDPDDRTVISLGSASKRFWGGLRIGWIRAREQRIAELGRLRAFFDMATPVVEQLAVTVMLEEDRRADERRALLRGRCELLVGLLADAFPDWRLPMPGGGLALWAELPRPDASALAAMAQGVGLRFVPGPRFAVDGGFERFVRLPYTLAEPDLRLAVARLAMADARLRRFPATAADPARRFEAERVI